jgi:hypothetical protein
VVEAIASGRVLISTGLPPIDDPVVMQGVLFSEKTVNSFLEAILKSRDFYETNSALIDFAAKRAADLYGEGVINRVVENLLSRSAA